MSDDLNAKMLLVHEILDKSCPPEISFLVPRDPFQFLISVILSAQTTDENVNRVTPELFSLYPDAASLANADIETVKKIIYKTGFFNTKAKNIIGCAKGLMERFGGKVPTEMEDLLTFPGVGRKTANCLRADVLDLPGIVVDTHFSRVINRVFDLGTRDPLIVEKYVSEHLAPEHWSRFSMTANLHGRQYCHPSKPECADCPLKNQCAEVAKVPL